jgi:phosphoesterase RecJ-like protein
MTWTELTAAVKASRSVLISSHVNPDGDCIGSQLAFAWYCRSLGKEVVIYNRDPVPTKLAFLQGAELITQQRPQGPFDLFVVLDASNLSRLGWEGGGAVAPVTMDIDHHEDNTRFATHNYVDAGVAATGQILYDFFTSSKIDYPREVAEALYTAVMTDTGGFRFANTDSRVLHLCADLVEHGVDPSSVYQKVYASRSTAGMKLLARVWSSLSFYDKDRICSMELPLQVVEELGANYGDSEGIADLTIMAEGVKVGMLIKHRENETHFSLRSNGHLDVGRIARDIKGGGGHSNAAGCTLPLPVEQAKQAMLAILAKELG